MPCWAIGTEGQLLGQPELLPWRRSHPRTVTSDVSTKHWVVGKGWTWHYKSTRRGRGEEKPEGPLGTSQERRQSEQHVQIVWKSWSRGWRWRVWVRWGWKCKQTLLGCVGLTLLGAVVWHRQMVQSTEKWAEGGGVNPALALRIKESPCVKHLVWSSPPCGSPWTDPSRSHLTCHLGAIDRRVGVGDRLQTN